MVAIPANSFYWRVLGGAADSWVLDADGTFTPTAGQTVEVVTVGASPVARITADTVVNLTGIAGQSVTEGATATINPVATGTNRVWSISGPAWATINASTGAVTLAPPVGAGSESVTVNVGNSRYSASSTFAVTVAEAGSGPTLATLPVTPTVRYHPGFSTVVETAGRVDSASDLMGLAQATKPTSGTGPLAMTDALGRKFWQFNGLATEYLNVATTLNNQSNRAITVFAVCRIFHTGDIYQIGSEDFGTTIVTAGPSLGIGAFGNGDAPCVISHGRIGSLASSNREYMASGTQLQVLGGRSNTTGNGATQLFINKRMGQRDQNSIAMAGPGIGGTIGRAARMQLYELVIYNRTVTATEAQSIADALTDHYAIPEVQNYLVSEGDSRFAGVGTTDATDVWSALITTPGAGYLDGTWRVQNLATSGNRVQNIVARRDNVNGWASMKLPGRNVVAYEVGGNDVGGGGFTEQQWYDALIPMLNTPTNGAVSGILQRGWEVVACRNYLPFSTMGLRYTLPQFVTDTQTGPGAAFEGKIKVANLSRIEVGGQLVLDVANAASDPYMQPDFVHPERSAHVIFITGGDTPQNGILATIAP